MRLNDPSLPDSSKQTLQKVRRYLIGNWDSIQRQRDPQYIGCSAEGHVSHWLSARLSLRPLGWSTTGAENIAKAIQYALNYENTFKTLLEDGHLVLSNNLAERAIKNLVIGRKNWLFSKSFEGAQTNAVILTMIETAKRHGLDSEKYINYLLTHLPNEPIFEKNEVLEAYLPCSELVQRHCQLNIQ